jgi:broad specificity phosphatase PhoE
MKIALFRHGPTDWNAEHRIQGHTDIGLSDEGLRKMQSVRVPFPAARMFSSPQLRARQSAAAMGFDNPKLDARLMEQNWGRWEGMSLAAIAEQEGKDAFIRAGRRGQFRPPGGESIDEVMARVDDFLRHAARVDSDAIAVTHMGVLRAAYTLATGWDMATPMPPDLDVSKILLLETGADGRHSINRLNMDFESA